MMFARRYSRVKPNKRKKKNREQVCDLLSVFGSDSCYATAQGIEVATS